MNFSDFQILPKEQAEEALSRCCGSQNWAKKMAQSRPFGSLEKMNETAVQIWVDLQVRDWLKLLSITQELEIGSARCSFC